MDRQIVYIGQIPQDTDQLQQNKNTMIGLGYLMQALMGTGTLADGLSCTPNSPAALNVLVGPGSIYSLAEVDATAYGSLNADTSDQIVKQGIIMTTQTFSTPAPITSGQSVVYLIEAAYQDIDGGSTVLPYYNASNPSVAWSGPNNTGVSQNTVRKGVCTIQIKTGVAATTGTQITPSPDAGFTGLYAITVANGQTTVTSGNIQQLSTAPFIGTKITGIAAAIQNGVYTFAQDTSVSANTITVAPTPAITALNEPFVLCIKVANTNTGATVMNVNGLGNVSVVSPNGSALAAGALIANGIYQLVYDVNGTRWQVQTSASSATSNSYYGATTAGSANAQTLASVTPSGFTLTQGYIVYFTAGNTNTGATTLAVNSTTATAVKKNTSSGLAALSANDIVATNDYAVYYDGTQYVLLDPSTIAFLASPAFTGTPTAPTASPGTNTTQLATCAFANAAATAAVVVTPLGIGSTLIATQTTGTIAAGGTIAASDLTAQQMVFNGGSSGLTPTTDTLSGTYQALQKSTSGANNANNWQRTL